MKPEDQPPPIPQAEFAKCKEALSRLTLVTEELDRTLETAKNQNNYEARRNLVLCWQHIEDAEHRLNKAIKAMMKKL